MRRLAVVLFVLFAISPFLVAQVQPAQQIQVSTEPTVTQYSLPPDKLAKAWALYRTRNVLIAVETIYGIAVLLALLAWRVAPRFRNWAEKITRFRFVQALIFAPLFLLTLDLLDLPFGIYGHHLGLKYGLSVQGWGSWFWDWTKSELVQFVAASLIIALLYAIIRKSPRRWWFYFWVASIPIILFVVFIAPVVLDPIFNKFEPLAKNQPNLVEQIERVTRRGGLTIPRNRMFEMRASEKVTTYNAYVTGFGATKRVVVWDNTARDLTTGETLFIFGHEMGHYVLNHIWKGLAFAIALAFVLFYLGFRLANFAMRRWGDRWQIRELGDLASLPLLLLLASVLGILAQPIMAGFSRHLEHQADIYGLEVTHGLVPENNKAAAASFQKLGEKGLSYPNPNPVLVFWMYDHPPIADRLRFSLDYRPWDEGEPTKYVK